MIREWEPSGDFVIFEDPHSKYHRPDKIKDLWFCLNKFGFDVEPMTDEYPIKFGKFTIEYLDYNDRRGNNHITVIFSVKDVEFNGSKLLGGYIFIDDDIMTRMFVSCSPKDDRAELKADLSAYTDYVLDGLFKNSKTFSKTIPKMRAKKKKVKQEREERYGDIINKFNWR